MQTIGRTLGKGTEKVRTWYNNRRALDRKLGIDVSRNPADAVAAPPFALFPTADPTEEPVVLPGYAIASPQTITAGDRKSDVEQDPPSPGMRETEPSEGTIFVNVTPSAIAWAPSASPVTDHRDPGDVSASLQAQPNRFRVTPLRIRNSRLVMGSNEICGEVGDNPAADRGLEVKFLFGKKRIVYEWYCGEDYSDAKKTGGPYAKMEMNFGSAVDMQLFKSGTTSVLELSFSAVPSTYLQTQESMDKFKLRAQQRQYRKVRTDEFPIPVRMEQHRISMRTDDAIRVARVLFEENPQLEETFKTWEKGRSLVIQAEAPNTQVSTPRIAKVSSNHKEEERLAKTPPTEQVRLLSLKNSQETPCESKSSPITSAAIPRQSGPCSTPCVQSTNVISPPTSGPTDMKYMMTRNSEVLLVRPITAASAAPNLLGSPAPWPSPATPFIPSGRPRGGEIMQWSTGVDPSSKLATPFRERTNLPPTPQDQTKVRRELNFNVTHNMPTETSTPRVHGRKRSAKEANLDDRDAHRGYTDALARGSKSKRRTPSRELAAEGLSLGTPTEPRSQTPIMERGHETMIRKHVGEHADPSLRALPR